MPIRILHAFAVLDRGGAEVMMMNIYKEIDREKIQFDFVVNDNNCKYAYEDEIDKLGGRVFRMPKYTALNHFAYKKAWKRLLAEHPEWLIIHAHHTSSAGAYFGQARAMGKLTIAHSHTAGGVKSVKSYIKILLRSRLKHKADYLFACSSNAAKWMFGKHASRVKIIKNAIDVEKFTFNNEIRKTKRDEFRIENKFVLGNIGRFGIEKNHKFLIDIFAEVKKKRPESVLLLVGDGELRSEIERKVDTLGLEDSVIFTGVRQDVSELLQAMDVFVFPSLFEGLPVTVIEAQAAGLPCLISDTITDEVQITDSVEALSLTETSQKWAENILKFADDKERKDVREEIKAAGYDVVSQTNEISGFYLDKHKA